MPRISEACPYDEAVRAAHCESCCGGHGALPPCVVAWLNMKVNGSAVAVFARSESPRKAA